MLVKFFKASGSARSLADYLEAEMVHMRDPATGRTLYAEPKVARAVPPEHLRGSFDEVVSLSESLPYAHTFTAGVIAFERGDDPTPEQIQAVVDDFQRHATPGFEADRTCWAWNIHRDKGNVELNFMTARVDLDTMKHLNVAPPGHENHFNAWRDRWNLEQGWADPREASRQRELKTPRGEAPDRLRDKEAITEHLKTLIERGQIEATRAGVLSALSELGEITRTSDDYISIKPTGADKALRLKGGLYAADFNAAPGAIEAAAASRRPDRRRELEEARAAAGRSYESRARYLSERYQGPAKALTDGLDRVAGGGPDPAHGLGRGRGLGLLEGPAAVGRSDSLKRPEIPSAAGGLDPVHTKRQSQPNVPKGALSHDRLSRAKISVSHLRESPAHGLRDEPAKRPDRGFLSVDWQAFRRGLAHPVQWLQARLRHGGQLDDRTGKDAASRIGKGFEQLDKLSDLISRAGQLIDEQTQRLDRLAGSRREAGEGLNRAGRQLERQAGGFDEAARAHERSLSRGRGMGFGR